MVLKEALTNFQQSYQWADILWSMFDMIMKPLTKESEELLLFVIKFDKKINIDLNGECPHSMPPEDMLKSIAIQALLRFTGVRHLSTILNDTTELSSLSSIVKASIQQFILENNMINYGLIATAISNYKNLCKYQEISVPWLVCKKTIDITRPSHARPFETFAGQLVASGEQSLLEIRSALNRNQKYLCATPCFRDEAQLDNWHLQYFFKVELMHVQPDNEQAALSQMISDAYNFFNRQLLTSSIMTKIDRITTAEGVDITINGVEVGSYGIREHEGFKWVYGTGLAEPRFSQAVSMV